MSDKLSDQPPFTLQSPGAFAAPRASKAKVVVYLHGFRSSPQSVKALKMRHAFEQAGLAERLYVPQLPASPAQALQRVEEELYRRLGPDGPSAHAEELVFIGSSLGGFYATVLAERYPGAHGVLLNPAVKPYEDLVDQIGKQKVYFSDEEIDFVPAYLAELKTMERLSLQHPKRYLLVAATGDEVLDFHQMVKRYAGAHQIQIEGSDHALSEFDSILPMILLFLGLK